MRRSAPATAGARFLVQANMTNTGPRPIAGEQLTWPTWPPCRRGELRGGLAPRLRHRGGRAGHAAQGHRDAARAQSGALSELSRKGVLPGRQVPRGAVRAGVGEATRPARPDALVVHELLSPRSESASRGAQRAAPCHRAQRPPRRVSQAPAPRSRSRHQERESCRDLPAARLRGVGGVRGAQLTRGRLDEFRRASVPRPRSGRRSCARARCRGTGRCGCRPDGPT